VTNNPNTLHERGCCKVCPWKNILHHFLSVAVRVPDGGFGIVGDPPEDDHKCREQEASGASCWRGIRLGRNFVGIQPARGFNLDLAANYHDPDLVPPHSYLAFYFWLRPCLSSGCLCACGKHGNLEWLPGKARPYLSLVGQILRLGPMPEFLSVYRQ